MQLIDGTALCDLIDPIRQQQQIIAKAAPASIGESAVNNVLPACPLCGGAMVLRTAKRGDNAGSQFWGCSAYPKCRGTRPLASVATVWAPEPVKRDAHRTSK